MNLEVLISCMNQIDKQIIHKTNISSDVLVINQTTLNNYESFIYNNKFQARIISTTERGLSCSRNMAIENATGDICLICDDDEILSNYYRSKIINSFLENPSADLILFSIEYPSKIFPNKKININYINSLKFCSVQIAFRREKILEKGIKFDINFGSGTGNGGGEENLFLFDCLKNKLKIIYVPINIGSVGQTNSQWFNGYNKVYFINRGKLTKKLLGRLLASVYAIEFAIAKYAKYKNDCSLINAIFFQFKGIFKNS